MENEEYYFVAHFHIDSFTKRLLEGKGFDNSEIGDEYVGFDIINVFENSLDFIKNMK